MGVINAYNASSSLYMIKSQIGVYFVPSNRPKFSFEATSSNQGRLTCMASPTVPVKQVKELTGDSFIRPHLRKLSPYQSILPFEVMV